MKLFKAYTKYQSIFIMSEDMTNAARKFAYHNGGYLVENSGICSNSAGWTSYKYFRDRENRQSRNAIEYSFQIKEMEVII